MSVNYIYEQTNKNNDNILSLYSLSLYNSFVYSAHVWGCICAQ